MYLEIGGVVLTGAWVFIDLMFAFLVGANSNTRKMVTSRRGFFWDSSFRGDRSMEWA
jgi:hypothetical protein